jgi:ankyrin repeat protein
MCQSRTSKSWDSFTSGVARGATVIACMLIERDADVSAQDKEGRTHLHLVSRNWRQLEVARMLIERGADVAAQNKEGQTPLHLASQEGRLGVARTLTEHGVDMSAQDKDGQTPLHLMNWYPVSGHREVARMLVERGADMSAQDKDGRAPMHIASQAGQLEDIRNIIVGVFVPDRSGDRGIGELSRGNELRNAFLPLKRS